MSGVGRDLCVGAMSGSIVLVGARVWVVGASEVFEATVDIRPSGARLRARCCVAVIALFIAAVFLNDARTSLMIPSNSCCACACGVGWTSSIGVVSAVGSGSG